MKNAAGAHGAFGETNGFHPKVHEFDENAVGAHGA
jgi:hypothetical protein